MDFIANSDVNFTINLVDGSGQPVTATAVSYAVLNEASEVIVAKTPLVSFVENDVTAVISVPASLNTIPAGATASVRYVTLYVTTEAGQIEISDYYIIRNAEVLQVGVNSFQLYPSAIAIAAMRVGLDYWDAASNEQRVKALAQAHGNIGRVNLRDVYDDAEMSRVVSPWDDEKSGVAGLNQQQLEGLDKEFLRALKIAQVIEANYLLGGNETDEIRNTGALSVTVGEAKQFYTSVKPLTFAICRDAMRVLGPWVDYSVKVSR